MGDDAIERRMLELVSDLALSGYRPSDDFLRLFLAALAHSGVFEDDVRACLTTAAEIIGGIDEILPEELARYLVRRKRGLRESDGKPLGRMEV